MFALCAGSVIVLLRSGGYRLQFRSVLGLLMAATAMWCAASLLWSIEPGIGARRLISAGCVALAALAAARILTPRELAASAMICSATYLAIGLFTELALGSFRPWIPSHRLAGTLHPNLQGLNCAVLVMTASYLAWNSTRHRAALCAAVVIGLIGLWLTKSRTPLASLLVAEITVWFITASWRNKLIAGLIAVFVVCSLLLVTGESIFDRIEQTAELGREENEGGALTGRVPLWEELSEAIARRPWQGYGFSSFWISKNIEDVSDSQQWAISVAHSSYLDLTLGTGLIGAGLAVAVTLWGLLQAIRLHCAMPSVGFGFIAVLLLFAMVHGVTESAFANPGFVPLVALSGLAMLAFVDPVQYRKLPATEVPQS
ncbi:MAG TPA: O-antigen ligase family protein [Pirellulales bacterium]